MSRDDQIAELLEEILETNRAPESVCASHVDLLEEVRCRLRKIRTVAAQVDSLFPASEAHAATSNPNFTHINTAFPSIPGYDVQAILGRGGMGIVYKARHLKLNRDVALKMLLTGSYGSRQEHLRFVREAESVAALRHPNIVQIYELGEVDGHPFYTMEYVGGGSLGEMLSGTMQPARESAQMISILARAVQSAHDLEIVHRDLKPANILLADDGEPKIADFGLARRIDQDSDLTHTGARIGTPSYMAPEQLTGSSAQLGPAVDVFALGAILYEMLTGQPPFRGRSLSDIERRLTTEDPTPPSRSNPKVPCDLETICQKCLEKNPCARYATAADLSADLERFLRHEPIRARPITPAERWMRWIQRNPLSTALVVTSVVLVCLIASQMWQKWALAAAGRAEKSRLTSRIESGIQLLQDGRFAEAHAILGKLGDGGFQDLRQRIDRVLANLNLVESLEAISFERAMALNVPDSTWDPNADAARKYEAAFAKANIGKSGDSPASVARHIGASEIKKPLIAALDDWAVCEFDATRRNWVLEVAREASSGVGEWENQSRDAATWEDREVIGRLAKTAPTTPSIQQLRALGDRLDVAGLDATAFRVRVQQDHVDNFLANLSLGDALRVQQPAEAIRYYQAALAIHPRSATAHNNLAVALTNLHRTGEAIVQFEESLKLDPNSAVLHCNLGMALAKNDRKEAIQHLQRAIELNPTLAAARRALAEYLMQEHRYSEAEESLRDLLTLSQDNNERNEIVELLRKCTSEQQAQ